MYFEYPLFAFLLIVFPVAIFLINKNKKHVNTFVMPIVSNYLDNKAPQVHCFVRIYTNLPYIIVILLVISLMHPKLHNVLQIKEYQANDIIIALDCSQSMLNNDIKPNRFEIAKQTTIDFINKRENDRIGIVGFAGECLTIMPLVRNHPQLINTIKQLDINNFGNGTAIGISIATALLRLKESKAKTKIIILISDGANNVGNIAPIDAIETAKYMEVKIYTIGIGKQAQYHTPNQPMYDTLLLKQIAIGTRGSFFQVNNKDELLSIYETINQLETTEFIENTIVNDFSIRKYFIIFILIIIVTKSILKATIFKHI